MSVRAEEITAIIKEQIERFAQPVAAVDVGTVMEVGDSVATIYGLSGAMVGELLEFPNGVMGLALNLEESTVGAVLLGADTEVQQGDQVRSTGRVADVPVGDAMLGRVVNALGQPIDGKGPIAAQNRRPVERIAPNVVTRHKVNTPVQTGIKAVDAIIPIGRGQRELIIGDRQTGKTALAVDAIINQKGANMFCVYCAIGQKTSKVAQVVSTLEQHGAMDYTVVVAATASDSAALQYMAPYSACAIAEEFLERGQDALVVYDDLSKHAWAYRQISLLLRRPPGREAYPGDVFYLHSRLLERAAKYDKEHGGGSLTALPIIETLANDISAYIPTNVISITDGQIFLESDLFYAGVRPALNVGLSVSRVGGDAQTKAMKQVAGKLRIDLAQYRELAAFAQFGTDLDKATKAQLDRGARITELLKQAQYVPMSLARQVVVMFAVTNGFVDQVPVEKMKAFEFGILQFMETNYPQVLSTIDSEKILEDSVRQELSKAIQEFINTVPF